MRVRTLLAAAAVLGAFALMGDADATRKSTYVYVHDAGDTNQVLAFSLAADGSLTALPGSPFVTGLGDANCGGYCQTMDYSKKRKALVVTGASGLHVLLVGKDGALTSGPNSPFEPDDLTDSPMGVRCVTRGKREFVYANAFDDDEVRGFELGKDGTLTELAGSPWATGSGPVGMEAVKNKSLFCINNNANSVSAFAIGKDGSLTEAPGSPFDAQTDFAYNIQADPKGKRVYIGHTDEGAVLGFAIARKTAALTPLEGSPFAVDVEDGEAGVSFAARGPGVVMPSGAGVTGYQAVQVGKDGSLTTLGGLQVLASTDCNGHARTANGKILVINSNDGLRSYSVDKKTGALALLDTAAFAGNNVNDVHVVMR